MSRQPIFTTKQFSGAFRVAGFTKDSNGAALPGVTVDLYSESRVWLGRTVSDDNGSYSFDNIGVGSVFIVAYLEGGSEVVGTTAHNIAPTVW